MEQIVHIDKKAWNDVCAQEGADWLDFLCRQIEQAAGGSLTAETMGRLTPDQITLYAYRIFRDEMLEGGFCQLIQNGYGPFIFENPFAHALKLWNIRELYKIVSRGNSIYRKNKTDLIRERTEEEFMAMYEEYEAFDKWEDEYIEDEECFTAQIKAYVLDHPGNFYELS